MTLLSVSYQGHWLRCLISYNDILELYNEEISDLPSAQDDVSRLRLYEDAIRKGPLSYRLDFVVFELCCIMISQGLEEVQVHSKSEVYSILEKESQIVETLMNA